MTNFNKSLVQSNATPTPVATSDWTPTQAAERLFKIIIIGNDLGNYAEFLKDYDPVALGSQQTEEAIKTISESNEDFILLIDMEACSPKLKAFASRSPLVHLKGVILIVKDDDMNAFSPTLRFIKIFKPITEYLIKKETSAFIRSLNRGNATRPIDITDEKIIGESKIIQNLKRQIRKIANSNSPIWIKGESGTGKELVAECIHALSPRSAGPFVAVNCAAFPETLIESMMFGHMRGSFSGAIKDQPGFFEAATGGTLFLDEIGDMPLFFQAKLLRSLQSGTVIPVGSTIEHPVDCRIITASHYDLYECVQQETFRRDLFYRLNVLNITVPTLKMRDQDIIILAEYLIEKIAREEMIDIKNLDESAKTVLRTYEWPGNIRELENVIRRAMIFSTGKFINHCDITKEINWKPSNHSFDCDDVKDSVPSTTIHHLNIENKTMREIEDLVILMKISEFEGCIEDAARSLGIAGSTIHRRMKKMPIDANAY